MGYTEYEVIKCGKKYQLKKIIGQYETKEEALRLKNRLLREDSVARGKEVFAAEREKGISRYC